MPKKKLAFILDAFVYLQLQKLDIYYLLIFDYVYTPLRDEDFKLKSKYLFYERTLTRNGSRYWAIRSSLIGHCTHSHSLNADFGMSNVWRQNDCVCFAFDCETRSLVKIDR